jgi:hypothetical protein
MSFRRFPDKDFRFSRCCLLFVVSSMLKFEGVVGYGGGLDRA